MRVSSSELKESNTTGLVVAKAMKTMMVTIQIRRLFLLNSVPSKYLENSTYLLLKASAFKLQFKGDTQNFCVVSF